MDTYYKPEHLPRFGEIAEGNPELAKKFFDWYGAVFQEGALSEREKSLIALAVSHALQCPYCIDAYSKDALEKGSDLEEMTEAIHTEIKSADATEGRVIKQAITSACRLRNCMMCVSDYRLSVRATVAQ